MSHAWHHAVSSAKEYGGIPEDYVKIHEWFDAPKEHIPDFRSRMFRHHTQGISVAISVFGPSILNSDGVKIPTQWICEQHMIEDFGRIPRPEDWVKNLTRLETESWMAANARSGPKKSPTRKILEKPNGIDPQFKPSAFN
tara:strand:- start:691 stop:1110 length:420 start_codon:yes stop_codon:yes gene_type:complete